MSVFSEETLPDGEKHFHAARQFPSQALPGIQHIVPVILHSSPHFVFELFPSARQKMGSKSCILIVQKIVHIWGHLTETLLFAQSSASGQPVKEGLSFFCSRARRSRDPLFVQRDRVALAAGAPRDLRAGAEPAQPIHGPGLGRAQPADQCVRPAPAPAH